MTFIESCTIAVNLELIHDLWVPNIFIYNLKTFQVIDVLSKLAGLWINNKKEVYYRFVLQSPETIDLQYRVEQKKPSVTHVPSGLMGCASAVLG